MSLPAVSTSSRAVLCFFVSVFYSFGVLLPGLCCEFFWCCPNKGQGESAKKTIQDCQMQASPIFCEQHCANILSFFVAGTINLQKQSTLGFTLHPGAHHFTGVKLKSGISASVKCGVHQKNRLTVKLWSPGYSKTICFELPLCKMITL